MFSFIDSEIETPPLPSFLPFPLAVGSPLNKLEGLGERCKIPHRGPGQSSGRKRIWCTLNLWGEAGSTPCKSASGG